MMLALAEGWLRWMVAMSWQVGLLVAVIWALDRLLGRTWPRLRLALWALVAVKLLLPPTLHSPVSVTAEAARGMAPLVGSTTPEAAPVSIGPWLFATWAVGCVALAFIGVRRYARTRRWGARGFAPPEHVAARIDAARQTLRMRRAPEVRLHPDVDSPLVLGLRRPLVLLPMRAADRRACDRQALDHMLLHELAHVRRGDLWMQALFALLGLVYWFHPLVAVARRRAHAAREVCCDLTVAGALGSATAYRRTLLELAARLLTHRAPRRASPAHGAGFLLGRSTILMRLTALERYRGRNSGAARAATGVLVIVLAAVLLPMAFDAPVPEVLDPGPTSAELEAARAHLAETLQDDARYGCFDKRFAFYRVLNLEEARAANSTASDGRRSP